tara:strand:+ start:66 stop:467 length:402 start_codon:yes stop_codon:yes gene_type:complete
MIRNSKQVTQAVSFKGLVNKKIHPTDIDLLIEIDDKYLIIGEVKRKGNKIPIGQKLAIERLCKRWENGNCIFLKIIHEFNDDDNDIPAAICNVEEYFYCNKWYSVKLSSKTKTLVQIINELSSHWSNAKLKLS